MQLKRILVPYDGETPSEEMLRLACLVAKSARGHVVALSVVPPANPTRTLSRSTTMSTRAVLERAEKVGALYGVEVNGLALQSSDVAATVLDKARELGSGAIFVGLSQGLRTDDGEELIREISSLVDQAPCPVLFGYLPEGEHDTSVE
ncbi:MAG: hypothetical protein EPO21_01410 [Chloroflexota bacterium]|nr:MAG: hypothetical protein EPO21_01410 [Chloroflexota bacterium]